MIIHQKNGSHSCWTYGSKECRSIQSRFQMQRKPRYKMGSIFYYVWLYHWPCRVLYQFLRTLKSPGNGSYLGSHVFAGESKCITFVFGYRTMSTFRHSNFYIFSHFRYDFAYIIEYAVNLFLMYLTLLSYCKGSKGTSPQH